jgi:hypothetical protein
VAIIGAAVAVLCAPLLAQAYNQADEEVRAPLYAQPWRLKFGANDDIDTAADEDVWTAGGDCQWPAAAAETTVVSDNVADAAAGTGCRTVTVLCLDDDLAPATQTATLNGTTPVTLATDCRRATRAYCATAGTGGVNAGTIDVKHGATIIGQIAADYGQTLIACDTVPDGYTARLAGWGCSATKTTTGVMRVTLDQRISGGAWRVVESHELRTSATAAFRRDFPGWQTFAEHTDLRVRARDASTNDLGASCAFDLLLIED